MSTVFVSYSHSDSDFADRLAADLRESYVPAVYDKWLLRVGDSIIEKISSAVTEADSIIAVLSPASVESQWVKKELSLAITGEINKKKVTVLPVLLKDCELPPMLADKFYADFRYRYYRGLRDLLEALSPSYYSQWGFHRESKTDTNPQELEELLESNDMAVIRRWFFRNSHLIAKLFRRGGAVSEAVPNFPVGNHNVDVIVVDGQSFHYNISAILLDSPKCSGSQEVNLRNQAKRLGEMLTWCHDHENVWRRHLAIRMAHSGGAEQVSPENVGRDGRISVDAKLISGQRSEYTDSVNQLRNEIYLASNRHIEIISYERILDILAQH